jgi:Bacterial SH3 domain
MRKIKKISYVLLLGVALLFSFQTNASAATGTLPTKYPYEARITWYDEIGTFRIISGSLVVRNYPGYSEPTLATYVAGESFNYDRIYEFKDTNHNYTHRYASYISYSGERRYVPFQEVRNGVVTRYANYIVE